MVNMREIAEEYRLSHWAQVMQARSASGMSVKAFCKSEGIYPNRYYYWQRKLREAALMATAAQNENTVIMANNSESSGTQANIPQGWALCESKKSESEQNTVEIEIGKIRITAHAGTDQELLAKVCRTLMSLC